MGLNIKTCKTLLISLSLIIALAGCEEGSEEGNSSPVSIQDVIDAQDKALNLRRPNTIENGEFAYFLTTQEIFSTQDPVRNLMEEEAITVIDREDTPDYFIVTAVREVIDHLDSAKPTYKFKDVLGFAKPQATKPVPTKPPKNITPLSVIPKNILSKNTTEELPVTFHNLQLRDIMVPKPEKVLEREPCPVNKDCRISAQLLTYDQVFTNDDGQEQRNQVELLISSSVPYFASVLRNCVTTIVAIDNSRPLVRQCKSVLDYQYLSPSEVTD